MITILRKIRRSLVSSGSSRKYLLYAVGEILLVVAGILIALQINTWNENRKKRTIEHESLIRLVEDLRIDSVRLAMLDSSATGRIDNTRRAIDLFGMATSLEEMRIVASLPTWLSSWLSIQKSTFEEMVNSGTLYSIGNHDLLKKITEHYKIVEKYDSYSQGNYNTLTTKWDQPAFAPFGIITSQSTNQKKDDSIDTSWIGQIEHPTFQAVKFALEHNLQVLSLNNRIVQRVKQETNQLIIEIEAELFP